ncbi:hypothetical protein Mrub_1981 [Meiothermus ruber DSM 1279]|uniref:Uncharacterized protein n=2 Tax=Meiothermus ruber TaxID=277 RepID=D3PTF4_MEIRD|nr:hypothetical protein Mrub_1981 [Meiothermus ruber DSM 1279]AGK05815.1 hypothetical protein K649_12645 [Meiothermus ruber DSM 1279]
MRTPAEILDAIRQAGRPVLLFYAHDTALRLRYLGRTALPDQDDAGHPMGYRPGELVDLFGIYSPTLDDWLEVTANTLAVVLSRRQVHHLELEHDCH